MPAKAALPGPFDGHSLQMLKILSADNCPTCSAQALELLCARHMMMSCGIVLEPLPAAAANLSCSACSKRTSGSNQTPMELASSCTKALALLVDCPTGIVQSWLRCPAAI